MCVHVLQCFEGSQRPGHQNHRGIALDELMEVLGAPFCRVAARGYFGLALPPWIKRDHLVRGG